MIRNILLQMLSFEEITKLFQIPVDIQGVETVTSLVPYVIMGIFGFLAFIGLRIYKNLQDYPNDEARIGKMKIHWQGNYTFEGNMSRYTLPLLPSTMEEVKQTSWFKKSGA